MMAGSSHASERFRLIDDTVARTYTNGSAVLIRPEEPEWLRTSESGAWMAELLRSGPRTAEEVTALVAEEYGVPSRAVEPSVHRFLDGLVQRSFLLCDGMERAHEAELEEVRQTLEQLTLLITTRCSSRCKHCYINVNVNVNTGSESQCDMPVALAEELLRQARDSGVRQIVISGGEPLLHPQLEEILTSCRKQLPNAYLKLQTGGAAVDIEAIDSVAPLVNDVQLGLDGIDAETHDAVRGPGSFDQVISVLKRLQKSKLQVARGLSFSPMRSNIEQIAELNELCYQLGIDYLQVNQPRQPADRHEQASCHECGYLSQDDLKESLEMFHELNKKLALETEEAMRYGGRFLLVDPSFNPAWFMLLSPDKRKTCQAGSTLLCFDPSGDAYPCSALHRRPGCVIGSFPETSLPELTQAGQDWSSAAFSVDRDPHCCGCVFRNFCGGGCRAAGPEVGRHDPSCQLIQETFDDFFRYVSNQEGDGGRSLSPLEPAQEVRHVEIIRCT
jgi:radical SAM protein with 4Fe4S-binding SPASM domain